MKIEAIETSGFASAFKALRLPYNKESYSFIRSETHSNLSQVDYSGTVVFDSIGCDIELAKSLIISGDSHAKPIRGILVYADITAPIYWWWDAETYRAGRERLFSASTQNTEGKGLRGKALQNVKASISFAREIRKIDYFSYQCLRNIVIQRYNHRLPEWHMFIEWIRALPFANELILIGLDDKLERHNIMFNEFKKEGCYDE